MKFYLGTGNPYKVTEFARILKPLQLDLEVTPPLDPEETESTFEGNALIKAKAYSEFVRNQLIEKFAARCGGKNEAIAYLRAGQYWTISEDSGLVIPFLKGLPGPFSARFNDFKTVDLQNGIVSDYIPSGDAREEIDLKNNKRVIELMKPAEFSERGACFVASLIVVDIDGNVLLNSLGKTFGWISQEMRGQKGFGYDPIFVHGKIPNSTFAEIDRQRKDLLSHRRQALAQFIAWLGKQLKN